MEKSGEKWTKEVNNHISYTLSPSEYHEWLTKCISVTIWKRNQGWIFLIYKISYLAYNILAANYLMVLLLYYYYIIAIIGI